MSDELNEMLQQVAREKDLPLEVIQDALQRALVQAFKRNYNVPGMITVELRPGKMQVISRRRVVEQVENPEEEIALSDIARRGLKIGDTYEEDVTPRDFSRIAAVMVRQVLVQMIRDAERDHVYDDFSSVVGEIRPAVVQRREGRSIVVTLDRAEAILPPGEQVPGEPYQPGDRLKVYILEARRTARGPQVIVSRTHFKLVSRLFEQEVPEVHDGVVEIKAIAREPGARTKLAVTSRDERVDPVGACVGHRGGRVQAIVNELYGERIDIIPWNLDMAQFITAALQPARVSTVQPDPENKAALVLVPDHQLSLAIGKHGQNVRLAARLTGWRIDIKSEQQLRDETVAPTLQPARSGAAKPGADRLHEPWGWISGAHLPGQLASHSLVPAFDGGVFQTPWVEATAG